MISPIPLLGLAAVAIANHPLSTTLAAHPRGAPLLEGKREKSSEKPTPKNDYCRLLLLFVDFLCLNPPPKSCLTS